MAPLIHNLLPLVLFCLLPLTAAAVPPNAVAVDSGTGEPLPAASVFDRKGNILGICSDKGVLPYASPDAYPLTVRYIGYLPALVESPSQQRVEMHPVDYTLPELTVEPGKRVVLHLTAYVREYSTLTTYTDTVFLFREKTVDFMVPTRKAGKYRGWTQPRLLASRSYYRFAGADGNDSVSNTFGQHFSWSDWIGIPARVDLPKALHNREAATDTLFGRYSPACIWRRNGDDLLIDVNVLADTACRSWVPALFARNRRDVEFTDLRLHYTFSDAGRYSAPVDNLSAMTFTIETNGRGSGIYNMFRRNEPYFVNTYAEMFFTDREYITVKDAKKLEKHPPHAEDAPPVAPEWIPDPDAQVIAIVERVDTLDHVRLHSHIQPDKRMLMRKFKGQVGPIGALRDAVKSLVKKYRGY